MEFPSQGVDLEFIFSWATVGIPAQAFSIRRWIIRNTLKFIIVMGSIYFRFIKIT